MAYKSAFDGKARETAVDKALAEEERLRKEKADKLVKDSMGKMLDEHKEKTVPPKPIATPSK